jgi:glyceraldehyde-3-phosphate dehydrogenase (NAD(P))
MAKNIVHVIGTGTIGEPLVGLLALHKDEFDIDEVTFHKNMPYSHDRPKLLQMMAKGAKLAARKDRIAEFQEQGIEVAYEQEEAIARATVVIDCTPSGVGIDNKNEFYERYRDKVRGFIAQGSEFGFGTMYARGINDQVLEEDDSQFVHVVSCNTHNLAALLQTLGDDGNGGLGIEEARFVCLRRANDISQNSGFVPAPQLGVHSDPRFGTHHAHDAYELFKTKGHELNLYSSSVKLNTQYMHAVHFSIRTKHEMSIDEALARLRDNKRVALTEKLSANDIFSFGREHGHYGRILSHTVVPTPTLAMRGDHEIVGSCFTPQDGNSLLSSVAQTLRWLDQDTLDERIDCLRPYLFQEI